MSESRGVFLPADKAAKETPALVEPREGIVTAYDHHGQYVGCIGSETWAQLIEETRKAQPTLCVIVYDLSDDAEEAVRYVRPGDPDWAQHSPATAPDSEPSA